MSYVQYMSEWQDIPSGQPRGPGLESPEVAAAADAVPFSIEARPTWSERDVRGLGSRLSEMDRRPGNVPPAAINNPPLYYLLQVAPYRLAGSADFFDRLYAMRLLSSLLGALTVAFCFLFVSEVLPRPRWAATVGGLAVAFQPMFGYMAGGVNNDNLLYACGAALIWLAACALRHGLTPRLGLALGAVALAGLLTKSSFAGLLPGAALAVLVAVWRGWPDRRRQVLAGSLAAAAVPAIPFALWLYASQAVFDRAGGSTTGGLTSPEVTAQITLQGQLSYLWQVFLPRLPTMQEFLPLADAYQLWDTFFQGFVGRFGWWFFGFSMWVNWVALGLAVTVIALAVTALARARVVLRQRWSELLCYVTMLAGFWGLVEVAAYRFQAVNDMLFEQTRYLLPLLPFYAGMVALAATAGGRRWGPSLAVVLVVLAMTHSLFAMLLVIGHYYA